MPVIIFADIPDPAGSVHGYHIAVKNEFLFQNSESLGNF